MTGKLIQGTLLMVWAVAALAQTTQRQFSTVAVTVSDELGAVIPKAFVMLHADSFEMDNPKPFSLEVRTNPEGEGKGLLPPDSTMFLLLRRDSPLIARNCECAMESQLR
jgi:hypothetical protein